MGKKNEWKKRQGIVYSTEADYGYSYRSEEEGVTLPPGQQDLKVSLDKSGRAGKQVTLVSGFSGTAKDLEILGKRLKSRCGVGGSVKEGQIIIQGDRRDQVVQLLQGDGYRARRSG